MSEAKNTSSIPWLLLFGAGYFLTAWLSHMVLFQNAPMGLVWAPNALMVAALVLAPRRSWWAVFAVAAVAHVMAMSSSTTAWRMMWQIAANAVFATVTTEALRRFVGFPVRFERRRDVMVYTSLAVTMPALLALIAPAFVMSFAGSETIYRPALAFARVVLANITPLLILTPAVLLGARFDPAKLRTVSRRRAGEATIIIGAVLVVSGVAFGAGPELARFPWLLILTVPPLLWAAVRLGPTGASMSVLCVAAISMWGATRQLGPFVVPADADVVLSLQIYWIMICLPVMLLSAAIREREVVEAALDDQRNQLARVTRIATAGELSGALAHELRQPMTAILANAQAGLLLLAREPADLPQIREILEDIASQDRQAGEVIARIRALLGGATSRRESVALESVVQDALSLTSQTAADANVRVQADVAAGLPPVRGDQVQLLQLLVNLVVNGCESMTDAAVTNRVLKLRVGRVGSDRLKVSVADSGVGLPVDAGDRVFEPFFTTKASGLGLGLSISRSVAAAHGGRLWGENNGGQDGATFHLELPADVRRGERYYCSRGGPRAGACAPEYVSNAGAWLRCHLPPGLLAPSYGPSDSRGIRSSGLQPSEAPMQTNSARTVLIVEPDEDSRSALRSALEGDGYTVISTASAADALSVVDGPRINLIVTELYLGSGADRCLLHTIRGSSATKRHKVLAYTRHGRAEDRAWAIAEGANGYVLKKNGEARMLEVAGRLSSPRTKRKRNGTRRPKSDAN